MEKANFQTPAQARYDVVIVGGAMYGSSIAWWTSRNPDFDGSILVVERDPSYSQASTSHTNSCIRQQFSNKINERFANNRPNNYNEADNEMRAEY